MQATGKQLFLSHTWRADEEGNDTHARAVALARELARLGWTVWLDEDDMDLNVDASMAEGIERSQYVIMLMTRQYARKINRSARLPAGGNDNCLKEFAYALRLQKTIVPVAFERCMLDVADWSPGVFPMRMASMLYTNGIGRASDVAQRVHDRLLQLGGKPQKHRRPIRMRFRSRTPLWPRTVIYI